MIKEDKLFIISDVHINDWDTRDPQNRYRLHQNRTVANNIINAARSVNANILVIAGDLFQKAINPPHVLAETELFLKTLMNYFEYGFIIWGNHDVNSKGDQEFIDCSGAVMLPPNLYYADGKTSNIGNTTIAFSNWKPSFKLDWIQKPVDLLITHATIQYTGGPKVNSQILDDTKFSLAICGDIHYPGRNGKYVSIGVPQQNKLDDCEKSTGIVFNTITKQWDWVDLNPQDNLLKFRRTNDNLLDGYDKNTNTWLVYQPANVADNGTIDTSKLGGWTDITSLSESIISEYDLVSIHNTILSKCNSIDSGEVDFNFSLRRLTCHDWRSIKDLTINFNEGDRILIQGQNGAGKSSILSALKYALCDTKDTKNLGKLDPFIRNGESSCWSEVEFLYQNKICLIRRGSNSKNCYCEINGERLKYNNKTDFENSMRKKFPFISYMSAYFFDENHQKFIGDCADDLSLIISKYLRLDKIELYNKTAIQLYSDLKGQAEGIINNKKIIDSKLSYNLEKLKLINLPERSLDFLLKDQAEGIKLQNKFQEYQKHQALYITTETKVKSEKDRLLELEKQYTNLSKPNKSKLLDLKNKLNKIDNDLANLNIAEQKITSLQIEVNQLQSKGYNLYNTIQNLRPDTCPTCGHEIELNVFNKYKNELNQQLLEIQESFEKKTQELNSLPKDLNKNNLLMERTNIDSEIKNIEFTNYQRTSLENSINKSKTDIQNLERELENLKKQIGEKVELPNGFLEMMANISKDIETWKNWNSLESDKLDLEKQLKSVSEAEETVKNDLSKLSSYIKITSPTGKIYEKIMQKLANEFSDNQVFYEASIRTYKGVDHLDLTPYYIKSPHHKVQYAVCSQGQKTILDIHLLLKITTRNGLLVMDEFLSHLSPGNHDICLEMISKMNVGCVLLSSHLDSIPTFYNRRMNLLLINDETCVSIC